MIKIEEMKPSYYEGNEVKTICFSCCKNHSTKQIKAENYHSTITIPLCEECLGTLTKGGK